VTGQLDLDLKLTVNCVNRFVLFFFLNFNRLLCLRGYSIIIITVRYIAAVTCLHIRENGVECPEHFQSRLRVKQVF